MNSYLERFLDAYIECALWSSTDNSDSSGGEPLDANYSFADVAPETIAKMRADCEEFIAATGTEHRKNWSANSAGHDFWLTRNRHGAGFWDRGQPDGRILTEHCEAFRAVDLYIGDDGLIYQE